METVEKIIANGLPIDFFQKPYINANSVRGYLDSICNNANFDARPSTKGTIITSGNATVVDFNKDHNGTHYTLTIFSSSVNYRSFDSIIPLIRFSVNDNGYPVGGWKTIFLYNDGSAVKPFDLGTDVERKRKFVENEYSCYINLVLATMTFLNCRNIVLVDKPQLPSIARHYEKRHKIPQVVYKELEVAPISYKYNCKPASVHAGSIPLHLCRGHIKTYTEEKPLFGRLTGRFYWHPHMRGNKENGEVVKDYKLVN